MNLGISGKTALILGGGGGLGRAIGLSLANEGANVALADIQPDALREATTLVKAAGSNTFGLVWDIANLGSLEPSIAQVEAALGPIDILINNTGGPPPTTAAGQDPALWIKHFESMVVSVIAITDRVLPGLRARKWGRIITSTSSGVVSPIPNLAISNALRLSLVGWSKTLAREVGRDGVTCNIVLPGRIATGRTRFIDAQNAKREDRDVDEIAAESCAAIPVGRYGDPEEYADVVAFLASERASYISGSVIRVDGGMIASI